MADVVDRWGIRVRTAKVELVPEDEQDRGFLHSVDGWMLTVIAALCAFGLVMVYSASEALGYAWYGDASYFFKRQALCLGIGAAGLLFAMRFDYHRLQRWVKPLTIAMIVSLLVVLLPHIGAAKYGAQRWLLVGPFSVQPSAIATLVAIVCFSHWLSQREPLIRTWRGVRDFGVLLVGLLALVLAERDLGSTIVIASVGVVLLLLGGVRKHHLLLILGTLALLGLIAVKAEPYRMARILNYSNPFADPQNTGYQAVQALFALGSGGVTGVGLGNSISKYQWLPEAHTDFIFAIIGEELGLVGTLSVVLAFTLLIWRGIRASLRAPDRFGVLLAGGVTAWVGIQAFVNIAAVTNMTPTTGIPLPFISYGGTSLVMTMVAMGILCNVSAQGRRQGAMRRAYVDRRGRNRGTSDPGARGRPGSAGVGSRG